MTVRVRFAPSPTGDLHIGGVRTALYNYLHARHEGGVFVLRIEDTDQARNSEDSLRTIKEGLAWCGLSWDEGPFYQSQRLPRYKELAAQLEGMGRAYWKEDPEKGKALYFRIDRGQQKFTDLIHGTVAFTYTEAEPDFVLLRSSGFPTFMFANAVDDHDMNVNRVLRGDDHLPNTPKQLMLFKAFGWTAPEYGHMPLIFDPNGEKLSKREIEKYRAMGLPVTVSECQRLGYLPEAILNFLALLGWSPGNNLELMTVDEMVKLFTVDRVGTTPARFLVDKLQWMNGQYIRKCAIDRLVGLCRPYLATSYDLSAVSSETLREAVRQQQERLKRLDEIVPLTRFVFSSTVEYDQKAVAKWLKADGGKAILEEIRTGLVPMGAFDKEPVEALLKSIADKRALKLGKVAQPLRVAVTGGDASPPMHETLGILGRDRVMSRIDATLKTL
ncbi:MAG TPA: glutamate--tRNA ligase family protein [Planctomycetota bacterium]|nr:glutamate--tRNA ligase family protein [Planctomycetota bacterium]